MRTAGGGEVGVGERIPARCEGRQRVEQLGERRCHLQPAEELKQWRLLANQALVRRTLPRNRLRHPRAKRGVHLAGGRSRGC